MHVFTRGLVISNYFIGQRNLFFLEVITNLFFLLTKLYMYLLEEIIILN